MPILDITAYAGDSITLMNSEPSRRIVLASESPRRRELMALLGLDFEVMPSGIDESFVGETDPRDLVRELALAKAQDIAQQLPGTVVIGADTVVVLENHILGKPVDEADARRMLEMLSGRVHQVMTGVAVLDGDEPQVGVEITDVRFRQLAATEIDAYIATKEPMDKAGAYAIQGRGSVLIESICGCYFNVVGLPVARLAGMLRRCGIQVLGTA